MPEISRARRHHRCVRELTTMTMEEKALGPEPIEEDYQLLASMVLARWISLGDSGRQAVRTVLPRHLRSLLECVTTGTPFAEAKSRQTDLDGNHTTGPGLVGLLGELFATLRPGADSASV